MHPGYKGSDTPVSNSVCNGQGNTTSNILLLQKYKVCPDLEVSPVCDWWLWGPVTTGAGHRDHYPCHTGHLYLAPSYGHVIWPPGTTSYGHLWSPPAKCFCAPTLSRKKEKSRLCHLIKWERVNKQFQKKFWTTCIQNETMTYNDTFCIQIRLSKGM